MDNPFSIHYPDQADTELVRLALEGDKMALQNLISRHQVFVYNVALKMTRSIEDAEDLTQEVFIKAITSLAKFKGKSSFRTWLHRIMVNHFLNTRKRKAEVQIMDFESYFNSIDSMPDHELTEPEQSEWSGTIEELRIRCTAGMLMCLTREQRLVFILGEMFEMDHLLGAEILGITPGNFRIRLMRARQDLYQWMNRRCGLINQRNPCRCSRKTRGYMEAGLIDPQNLQFTAQHKMKIYQLSEQNATSLTHSLEDLNKKIFRTHPLQEPRQINVMEEILSNELVKSILRY
jgi:RNA polymerase sigma factor (sigma-70 family)